MNYDISKQRGWVMRIVDRVYPDGIDIDTVKKQLIDLRFTPSNVDMKAIAIYLEQKGLINISTVGTKELERTILKLTATGKDLIDEVIEPVAGVEL